MKHLPSVVSPILMGLLIRTFPYGCRNKLMDRLMLLVMADGGILDNTPAEKNERSWRIFTWSHEKPTRQWRIGRFTQYLGLLDFKDFCGFQVKWLSAWGTKGDFWKCHHSEKGKPRSKCPEGGTYIYISLRSWRPLGVRMQPQQGRRVQAEAQLWSIFSPNFKIKVFPEYASFLRGKPKSLLGDYVILNWSLLLFLQFQICNVWQ